MSGNPVTFDIGPQCVWDIFSEIFKFRIMSTLNHIVLFRVAILVGVSFVYNMQCTIIQVFL